MSEPTSVPRVTAASLVGVWKRKLIRWPDGREDTASTVLWLQAKPHFADIRLPADRPSFDGVSTFRDCSTVQRTYLAGQQGFAGVLRALDGMWQWDREIDFQRGPNRDIGRLRFADASTRTLIEDGVEEQYTEVWERLTEPGPATDHFVLRHGGGRGMLVGVGDWFVMALDRRPLVNRSVGETTSDDTNLLALDMEISAGRRQGPPETWTVAHSTFPWREGKPLFSGGIQAFDWCSRYLVEKAEAHDSVWYLQSPTSGPVSQLMA